MGIVTAGVAGVRVIGDHYAGPDKIVRLFGHGQGIDIGAQGNAGAGLTGV